MKNLLVFSSQPEFSEWLRLSLEETGHYRVDLCNSTSELLALLAQPAFDIIIVDFPGGDIDLSETLGHFTQRFPNIPLLLIPPENDPHHPEVAAISAWAYLPKPFYLPDLLLAVETLSKGEKLLPPPPQMPQALEALQQQLQSFITQEGALAAWIVRAGHLLTRVENLEGYLSQHLLKWVEQRWPRWLGNGEWLRYWNPADPNDTMLIYVTPLIPQTLLLVAFAASLPPALARAKGRALAASLKASPWLTSELVLAEAQSPSSEVLLTEEISSSHTFQSPDDDTLANILDEEAWLVSEEGEEETSPPDLSLLEQWLSEAPPPNPPPITPEERTNIQPDWQLEAPFTPENLLSTASPSELDSDTEVAPAWEFRSVEVEFEAAEEAHVDAFEPPADFLEALTIAAESLTSAPPQSVLPAAGDEAESPPLSLTVEDTQPLPLSSLALPVETKDLLLTYTAVLVTSLPNALQNPRATTELTRWMPHWCQRLGWTIKRLVITPNYLLWTITVPSSTPPRYMVQAVRHHSAWRLFHRIGDSLGDVTPKTFWAPIHLVLAGESPPPNAEIDALISRNRSNR